MPIQSNSPRVGNLRDGGQGSQPPEADLYNPTGKRATVQDAQQALVGMRAGHTVQMGRLAEKVGIDTADFGDQTELGTESQTVLFAISQSGRKKEAHWTVQKWTRWTKFLHNRMRRHKDLVEQSFYFGDHGVMIHHPFPRLRRIVVHNAFETVMAFLIVANCAIIGWQAELRNPQGMTEVINTIFEHSFTAFFSIELVLRAIVFNWTFWFDSENHLDIFLVALSVLNSWILKPANIEADFLRKASVLRILRLIRIAKNFKRQFKEMWQLLRGLRDSFETLLWTYVMVNVVLYFFAILATVLFGKMDLFNCDEDAQKIVEDNFDTVLLSMLTLFQIMTLDSWSDIMRPMMAVQVWVAIFFIVFITISVFLLMNLITSVIVNQAFDHGKEDKLEQARELAEQREKDTADLKEMFLDMDEDGTETLSKEEIKKAWKLPRIRQKFRNMDISKKDLAILWTALDDGEGELSIQDFLDGMRKLKGEAKAKDILKLYREVRILESSIREISILSDYSKEKMNSIKMKLRNTFRVLDAVRRTLGRIKETARLASRSQPLCVEPKVEE